MKNTFYLLLLFLLIGSCASTEKMSKESINSALMGQNELLILKRLGAPSRVVQTSDGGRVMVYEQYSEGPYLAPNKSNITNSAEQNHVNGNTGFTYTSNTNKAANNPNSTIYQTKVSYLKVFINKQGNCVRLENTLSPDQMEVYQEQFNRFKTEE